MPPRAPKTAPLGLVLALSVVIFALAVLALVSRAADESPVLAWNRAMLDAVRCETTPPTLAARNLAILHLALDEACLRTDKLGAHVRADVVLAITGGQIAAALCPGRRGEVEAIRETMLAARVPGPTAQEWSIALRAAADALDARSSDGASRTVTYIPHAAPGQWRRTPPFFRPPEMPQWTSVRLFAGVSTLPGSRWAPPALDTERWQAALEEVRRLGGRESGERTQEQAMIARFWSDFSYTNTPPGHWNEIAAAVAVDRGLGLRDTARLFAQLNVALADAAIVCWKVKYAQNFWRPVTALAGEAWQPYLNTPPHPEYPSGHSVFSGAAAEVLTAFFGTDGCAFTVRSDSVPGVVRTFTSFSAAAREISESRIYGGIHFRFSCEDGLELGRAVAREVLCRSSATPPHASEFAAR